MEMEEALDDDLRGMEAEMSSEFQLVMQEDDLWKERLEEDDARPIGEQQEALTIRTHWEDVNEAIMERYVLRRLEEASKGSKISLLALSNAN